MHKYLTELIGVFFLALTTILATTGNYSALAPVAAGTLLAGLTGVGRDLSGAHFNPVVSLAMLIRGKMEKTDILYYLLAQILGAILAGTIAVFLMETSQHSIPEVVERQSAGLPATVAELLGAFAWTIVALHAVVKGERLGRSGLLLGMTIMALGIAFRDISGALFNPALAVASMIAGMFFWADLPLYIFGPLLGAGAAASVFYFMDKPPEDEFNI